MKGFIFVILLIFALAIPAHTESKPIQDSSSVTPAQPAFQTRELVSPSENEMHQLDSLDWAAEEMPLRGAYQKQIEGRRNRVALELEEELIADVKDFKPNDTLVMPLVRKEKRFESELSNLSESLVEPLIRRKN